MAPWTFPLLKGSFIDFKGMLDIGRAEKRCIRWLTSQVAGPDPTQQHLPGLPRGMRRPCYCLACPRLLAHAQQRASHARE